MANTSQPDIPSLRVFGLIWAGLFAVMAVWPLLKQGELRIWAVGLSAAFLMVALVSPRLFSFTRMYQGWVKLGEWVGYVNSRIIMAIMFFAIFTPIGLLFRILGRDPLRREPDPKAESYFIRRESQPGPMKHQF